MDKDVRQRTIEYLNDVIAEGGAYSGGKKKAKSAKLKRELAALKCDEGKIPANRKNKVYCKSNAWMKFMHETKKERSEKMLPAYSKSEYSRAYQALRQKHKMEMEMKKMEHKEQIMEKKEEQKMEKEEMKMEHKMEEKLLQEGLPPMEIEVGGELLGEGRKKKIKAYKNVVCKQKEARFNYKDGHAACHKLSPWIVWTKELAKYEKDNRPVSMDLKKKIYQIVYKDGKFNKQKIKLAFERAKIMRRKEGKGLLSLFI